jgi:predicted ATPase
MGAVMFERACVAMGAVFVFLAGALLIVAASDITYETSVDRPVVFTTNPGVSVDNFGSPRRKSATPLAPEFTSKNKI